MSLTGGVFQRSSFRIFLLAFALGIVSLFVIQRVAGMVAPCVRDYDLLSPTVRCATPMEQSEWQYEPLRNTLISKIAELQSLKKVMHVAVYFRDLSHGPRFGIEENTNFYPASLLKVPVMMAVLHEADRQPGLLDKTLSFSGTLNDINNVEEADETIQPNTPYTIRELLRKMIVYSDNYSKNLLVDNLNTTPPPVVYHTFLDLGVITMMDSNEADSFSVQSYANLFPILYSRGYLSTTMSQFALKLLSESTYKDGLVAGVPPGTRIAHKFGFHAVAKDQSQLHDCGIVYHPAATYVLCVMTSGSDIKDEASSIADVSRLVYDGIVALHSKPS